jgi:hypothetical protein
MAGDVRVAKEFGGVLVGMASGRRRLVVVEAGSGWERSAKRYHPDTLMSKSPMVPR